MREKTVTLSVFRWGEYYGKSDGFESENTIMEHRIYAQRFPEALMNPVSGLGVPDL